MRYWPYFIPVFSTFTGWFTIWFASWLLFHPRKQKKILGFVFQAIFPSLQEQLTEKLAALICQELPSLDEIILKITSPANVNQLLPFIDAHIDYFLRVKLKERMPIVGMFIGDKTIGQMKAVFMEELTQLFPGLIEKYMDTLLQQPDIEKLVSEKVQVFTREKLEAALKQAVSKEIRPILVFGAVLGLLVGLIQLALILLTS